MADGKFFSRDELDWETPYWGRMTWVARPDVTGSRDIVVGEVEFAPGGFHHFHYHPGQEEVLYVLEGKVEQWLGTEKRVLGPGESLFVARDAVHASFNVNDGPSRIVVVVGPCVGPEGYAAVEVSEEEAWKGLRPVPA
jgi:quercetin dioxygenase-like cupin family protein